MNVGSEKISNMNIAVLVSGGVDSAVALALLKKQGYQVTPFYLKIWLEDELSFLGECPWEEDLQYARAVCEQLGLELKVVSLQEAYKDKIIGYTIEEIKAGRTPNPDMLCNTYIKFGTFWDRYGAQFDKVATGHYAGVVYQEGRWWLERTPDALKDQTYFLARLSQEQLAQVMFPLAAMTKEQVRTVAQEFDLPNKVRKDSQGLCFLGKIKFKDFIRAHVGVKQGNIVEYETKKVLGLHDGFWFYTIGQRQGIGLAGGPWYVVDKDPVANLIYVSKTYYDEEKARNSFVITDLFGALPDYFGKQIEVKLRHGAQLHKATVEPLSEERARVALVERDQGIAAGQFAVFYDGRRCIGSGVIEKGE